MGNGDSESPGNMFKQRGLDSTQKCYEHKPETVLKNEKKKNC